MTKEQAKGLDMVLAAFTPEAWKVRTPKDEFEYCDMLEALGYIKIEHKSNEFYYILLTDKGNEFRAKSSFVAQYNEAKSIEKERKWNIRHNMWAVIISVISLIISIIALVCSLICL